MKRVCAIMLLTIIAGGCGAKDSQGIQPPKLNFSSPTETVKSYMRQDYYSGVKAQEILNREIFFKEIDAELLKEYQGHVVSGGIDIVLDVKEEREKTAIVKVSHLYFKEETKRSNRDVHLEKIGDKWKIVEVRLGCSICDETGKTDDYNAGYPFKKITCKYCSGKGWSKGLGVPSLRY